MKNLKSDRLESAVAYIDGWLDFNYRDSRLPGLVVAIQHDDQLLLNSAFGCSDQVNGEAMTPGHVFRIASHSKTFTATAIMQLYEAGKLRLDDKISAHLDWFTSGSDAEVANITIRHFLNHTSGLIRDGVDADYWQLEGEFPSRNDLKSFVKNAKLHTLKTSEHFKYSNYAYSFLGQVIEAASGMSYAQYVSASIVDKLGLHDTYPELSPAAEAKLANGHTSILFNSERKIVPHLDTDGMVAATGFCSTASDLCTYFLAHCYGNDTLISDASKREMQHGYWSSGNSGDSYGLGMAEYQQPDGVLYGHGGGFPGFITSTRFDPHQKLVVSVLTNAWDGQAALVAKSIVNILHYFQNNEGEIKDATRFEGRFFGAWSVVDIVNVNGKLISVGPRYWSDFGGNNCEELTIVDKNTLQIEKKNSYGSTGEGVLYNFDENDNVVSIKLAGMSLLIEEDYLTKK